MYPTKSAAVILPVVERIAPDRLAEFFWRAVAFIPGWALTVRTSSRPPTLDSSA